MNFEEILNAKNGATMHREMTPLGEFYKKQYDGKYLNVVSLKPQLVDSIVFGEAIKSDKAWADQQTDRQQLHFELHSDSGGIYEVETESGSLQTLHNLLENNPAVVAQKGFIDGILNSLVDYLAKMNAEGIFQLCLSPKNIFVRKGGNVPMLLTHGSFYQAMLEALYADCHDSVAPEVLARGQVDERSDVYALGRLIESLYAQSEIPFGLKKVIKKATADDPAQRYQTVTDMKKAIDGNRNTRRTLIALAAAVALALLVVWVYVEMLPDATTVEFVEPAPSQTDDPFSSYYDPEMDLLLDGDTLSASELDMMYQRKAEEIFRKRYAQEADRILSDIYDNNRLSATGKNYAAGSQSQVDELTRLQTEMGQQAGLSEEEAGRIGQEIVDKLTQEKQEQQTHKGYIKPEEE